MSLRTVKLADAIGLAMTRERERERERERKHEKQDAIRRTA